MSLHGHARELAVMDDVLRGGGAPVPRPAPRVTGLLRAENELSDGSLAVACRMLVDVADHSACVAPGVALYALAQAGEAADALGDVAFREEVACRALAFGRQRDPAAQLWRAHAIGMAAAMQGRHELAAGPLRRVVRLARRVDDCTVRASASIAALMLGDDRLACDLAAQAVAIARRRGEVMQEPRALAILAHCETALGRYPAALATAAEGLRLAGAAGQLNRVVELHALAALAAALQGDEETAMPHLEMMSAEVDRRGLTRPAALASWAMACLDLAADRPADAVARLRTPTGAAAPVHPAIRLLAAPYFVEAAVRAGRLDAARHAADGYERWARRAASPARQALAARCRALLLENEADHHFAAAVRLHRVGDSAFELARTQLLLGHHLRRGRRPRDAREPLREAVHTFERAGATRWAEHARAELRAAGDAAPVGIPASGPGTLSELTAQQLQISRLVAGGATNREIAARLLISPRTVDGHLRNIFNRLGIRSRVELARLAGV